MVSRLTHLEVVGLRRCFYAIDDMDTNLIEDDSPTNTACLSRVEGKQNRGVPLTSSSTTALDAITDLASKLSELVALRTLDVGFNNWVDNDWLAILFRVSEDVTRFTTLRRTTCALAAGVRGNGLGGDSSGAIADMRRQALPECGVMHVSGRYSRASASFCQWLNQYYACKIDYDGCHVQLHG